MTEQLTAEEDRLVTQAILAANAKGWGLAVGLLLGVGLFVATNVLIIQARRPIGPHLALLGVYFPGYRVTFLGSLIGFAYAFVVGYVVGRTTVSLYNRLVTKLS